MKTTIVIFALIVGFITPTFSQVNRHRKIDRPIEQLQNKKNIDFGNYKFGDKFSFSPAESFDMSPIKPGQLKFTKEIYSGDDMPCLKPTGTYMPCVKPDGIFSMRVYKPESFIWGILW